MLALATGWTPDVLAELPQSFRAAAHWALYAGVLCGPEGLPSTEIPRGVPVEARMAALQRNAALLPIRDLLYPEDED